MTLIRESESSLPVKRGLPIFKAPLLLPTIFVVDNYMIIVYNMVDDDTEYVRSE